ncbi:MAG: hypothetical protein ACKVHP_18415 [Verrucomicrobiales bacterium]
MQQEEWLLQIVDAKRLSIAKPDSAFKKAVAEPAVSVHANVC